MNFRYMVFFHATNVWYLVPSVFAMAGTHILHHTNLFIVSLVLKEFIHSLVKSFTSLGNILLYDTHDEVFASLSSLDRSTINQQFK